MDRMAQIESEISGLRAEVHRLAESSARVDERLEAMQRAIIPPREIYTGLENAKTRIGALEESNRESKRTRWRSISAIVAAVISGLIGLVSAWFRQ